MFESLNLFKVNGRFAFSLSVKANFILNLVSWLFYQVSELCVGVPSKVLNEGERGIDFLMYYSSSGLLHNPSKIEVARI